ncbi:hypothetical protein BX661DRAFT_179403 [Kickxella alabastrina]|uniref:uncharacterized protein n=1 Tax=Kickxella alabastrina TaxID=61397 RepID=UPI00221FE287|nr:uncharacterized protein BX661DRAFT_179403 [Kickxella alabastrina]KAI7831859.1 hypothetical protein BX661DRAFT_179403 [Kickxella alabastrina]KAJ1943520.1 hypothetical protein GGF37_002611 [Kickxella alabastrina]
MVSYTDLSPLKQPDAPVAIHLNDPLPEQIANTLPPADEWHEDWSQMHSKILYFGGVTEDALPELQKLFKSCRGIRLNVDPHESAQITGNVEFRNVYDTEKAMVVLNNKKLNSANNTLKMTPLAGNRELAPPPLGGFIWIKHIPEDATEATLYDFLRPSGPLYACSFPTLPNGQRKGIAYACFTDESYAQIAIEQLNYAEYLGNNVSIQISSPPRQSRSSNASAGRRNSGKAQTTKLMVPQSESRRESDPVSPTLTPQSAALLPPPSRQSSLPRPSTSLSIEQPISGSGNGLGGVIVPGKLFVTNLHPTVSHKELFALFKKYGYIQSARVSIDPGTKKSRGHGIVQFSDPTAALDALRECQGADIKGRKITMYQYEHVNKQAGGTSLHQNQQEPEHEQDQQAAVGKPLVDDSATGQQKQPQQPQRQQKREEGDVPPVRVDQLASQQNTVPFPRPASVASTMAPAQDPLIEPIMLRNLSESSRNEILTQKLAAEIAANPAIDVGDASRIVSSFIKRPLEDILALLSDPSLLASEWDLEEKAALHMPAYPTMGVPSSPKLANGTTQKPEGVHLQDYDSEVEEYIEMLLSKPENERKKKLGSKLFPLIKGMGHKESTKLTVWILDHMSHDVRSLAYTLNDPTKLYEIVEEAQKSIGSVCK